MINFLNSRGVVVTCSGYRLMSIARRIQIQPEYTDMVMVQYGANGQNTANEKPLPYVRMKMILRGYSDEIHFVYQKHAES